MFGNNCCWIIILILLFTCGGCGANTLSNGCGCGCGNNGGCGCGNNNGCGCGNNDCGCGC